LASIIAEYLQIHCTQCIQVDGIQHCKVQRDIQGCCAGATDELVPQLSLVCSSRLKARFQAEDVAGIPIGLQPSANAISSNKHQTVFFPSRPIKYKSLPQRDRATRYVS